MRIYLLRHGIASSGKSLRPGDDHRRPLTAEGKRRMRLAAKGMKAAGWKFHLILTSPLLRARQTAAIAARGLGSRSRPRLCDGLAPGRPPTALLEQLARSPQAAAILLVGHEPGLSSLAELWLRGPGGDSRLVFKKGGLCRIDFPGRPQPGTGRLILHVPPRLLRRLGQRCA